MFILKSYKITNKTILIMGEYDATGKLCTRVVEGKKTFIVNQTPEQVLESTLNHRGQSFQGARVGSKFLLGKMKMYPIMVDPLLQVCMFPSRSPKDHHCIWFNVDHIFYTTAAKNRTIVYFSNGRNIMVDSKLTFFNNKKEKAMQLKQLTAETSARSMSMVLDPKTRYEICNKTGKYNFVLSDTTEE